MTLKHTLAVSFLAVASLAAALPAQAQSANDNLANCMADNTSGKDRKDLARWVFAGMAAHPEIKRLSKIDVADRTEIDKTMADLLTRLLTERCSSQVKAVAQAGGNGMELSFRKLGELAMRELMNDPAVNMAMGAFVAHADQARIQQVLAPNAAASAPK